MSFVKFKNHFSTLLFEASVSFFSHLILFHQDCFRRFAKKKFEMDCMERMNEAMANSVSLQAGLRTLHEAGPEIKRATSSALEEIFESDFQTTRR